MKTLGVIGFLMMVYQGGYLLASKYKKIENIRWVKWSTKRPGFFGPPRVKGLARLGLAYEKKFAAYAKAIFGEKYTYHGGWFYFETDEGRGWRQPDVLVVRRGGPIFLFECKLTYTRTAAIEQMRNMYRPLIQHVWPGREVRSIQVCRHRKKEIKGVELKGIDEALMDKVRWLSSTMVWKPT